jgi:hypothetical protein
MRRLLSAALVAVALLPAGVLAKGEGVGLWMEGQVSEVAADGKNIRLVIAGRFWFEQYRGAQSQPSVVEVRDLRGGPATIPATLTQGRPFYAMTENWGGGAIRNSGALLGILQAAAGSGKRVKLELANARLQFGSGGTLAVESATVRRATDHSLR